MGLFEAKIGAPVRLLGGVPVLVLGIVAASCGTTGNRTFIREHIEQVKARTILHAAVITANSETQFGQWAVSADWSFETNMSEADYRAWVQRQFDGQVNEAKATKVDVLWPFLFPVVNNRSASNDESASKQDARRWRVPKEKIVDDLKRDE
jgi:hypothetical protein